MRDPGRAGRKKTQRLFDELIYLNKFRRLYLTRYCGMCGILFVLTVASEINEKVEHKEIMFWHILYL